MPRYLIPVFAAGVLILGLAYLQGNYSERWGKRPVWEEQKVLAQRLAHNVPTEFGDWISEDAPVTQREMEAAGAIGYYSRTFHKRGSSSPQDWVGIFVIVGHPADMTIHTPDKCYVTSGYSETSEQEKFPVRSDRTEFDFYTDKFSKGESFEGAEQNLRVFWSFSADGNWIAPTVPKVELMHNHAVVKVYARTVVPKNSPGRADDSPAVAFLSQFMPVLNSALFPREGDTAGKNTNANPAITAPEPSGQPPAMVP